MKPLKKGWNEKKGWGNKKSKNGGMLYGCLERERAVNLLANYVYSVL